MVGLLLMVAPRRGAPPATVRHVVARFLSPGEIKSSAGTGDVALDSGMASSSELRLPLGPSLEGGLPELWVGRCASWADSEFESDLPLLRPPLIERPSRVAPEVARGMFGEVAVSGAKVAARAGPAGLEVRIVGSEGVSELLELDVVAAGLGGSGAASLLLSGMSSSTILPRGTMLRDGDGEAARGKRGKRGKRYCGGKLLVFVEIKSAAVAVRPRKTRGRLCVPD